MTFPPGHPFAPLPRPEPVDSEQITDLSRFARTQGWRTFDPVVAGLTVGDGTFIGHYLLLDGMLVEVVFDFTFGTTSTFTALLTIEVPVPASDMYNVNTAVGQAHIRDGASASYECATYLSGDLLAIRVLGTAANHANYVSMTDAIPMAWAAGDTLRGSARYRPG